MCAEIDFRKNDCVNTFCKMNWVVWTADFGVQDELAPEAPFLSVRHDLAHGV